MNLINVIFNLFLSVKDRKFDGKQLNSFVSFSLIYRFYKKTEQINVYVYNYSGISNFPTFPTIFLKLLWDLSIIYPFIIEVF